MKKTEETAPLSEKSAEATADKGIQVGTSVGKAPEPPKQKTPAKNPVEKNQESTAHQPDVPAQHNTTVVNPIAPPVEPQGPGDYVVRQQATPEAMNEPTELNQAQQRFSAVLDNIMERHNVDHDQRRVYREQAGL